MRCNLTLRVLLRRHPAQHRRRMAGGAAARRAAARVPGPGRPAGQPDRRRNLHAQGHPRASWRSSATRATSAATSRPTARSSPTSAPTRWRRWPRAGFLKHISVSIDGPGELHDKARGVKGTFERTAAGPPAAAGGGRAGRTRRCASASTRPSRTRRSTRCTEMVDVAERARRRRHRPQSPDVQHAGRSRRDRAPASAPTDASVDLDVRHDGSRARSRRACGAQVDALAARCRERGIRFDMRPKVKPASSSRTTRPARALEGRCLYPFLYARVSFSGKAYFCPFIRIEVGDLTTQSLEEVWTGERYVSLAAHARREWYLSGLPAVLQGRAVARPRPTRCRARPKSRWPRRPRPDRQTPACLVQEPSSSIRRSSAASPSRARAAARNARKCSARPSRPTRWRSAPRCSASAAATCAWSI